MGAHKSLATEADYASVLRTANRFRAEADQLRELNAELLEALREVLIAWDAGRPTVCQITAVRNAIAKAEAR